MILVKMMLILTCGGFVQLASDREADELLVSSLVDLSELSEGDYCARFSGTLSSTAKDIEPRLREIYAVSAKHKKFEFHTWGCQTNLDSHFIDWNDALRDNGSLRRRFKSYTQGGADRHKDLDMESESLLKQNAQNVWPWPELDPFGLVFGSESKVSRRFSDIKNSRDLIARFEYEGSKILKNRNKVGTWTSPNHKTRYTIEFNRNANNLPSVVKLEIVENKQLLGLTQIKWMKFGKNSFVPEIMSITSERDDGTTVQYEFQWEWVPQTEWSKWCEKKNFEKLFEPEVLDFRTPFLELFEDRKK